ncbi:synaptopodin-2 [Myotis daubentonii]|uniref:synaptopodin-2 n=1 Tax=Myotis daubentonii TaxID=98922 RepID=UPI002873E22A|nr:synaptopodin-2 [Myotis daubentonii]
MGTGDFICISMTGGAPWGFRLQGGKEQQQPLQVAKIRSQSKASGSGLCEGDEVVSINGNPCADLTYPQVIQLMESVADSLHMLVKRPSGGIRETLASETENQTPEHLPAEGCVESTTLQIRPATHSQDAEPRLAPRQSGTPLAENSESGPAFSGSKKEEEIGLSHAEAPHTPGPPRGRAAEEGVLLERKAVVGWPGPLVELQLSLPQDLGTAPGAPALALLGADTPQSPDPDPNAVHINSAPTSERGEASLRSSKVIQVRRGQELRVVQGAAGAAGLPCVEVILDCAAGQPAGGCGLRAGAGRVDSPLEGGQTEAPPSLVAFAVSSEGTEQGDDPREERDHSRPHKHRARHARLRRSESLSEKQVKEAKSRCRSIAQLLTAAPSPHSRGVQMFKKRRRRARRFTLVSYGTGELRRPGGAGDPEDDGWDSPCEAALLGASESDADEELPSDPDDSAQVVAFDWDSGLGDFEKRLSAGDKMEMLPDTSGKGALMFARRRERMEQISAQQEEGEARAGAPAGAHDGLSAGTSYRRTEEATMSAQSSVHRSYVEVSQGPGLAPQHNGFGAAPGPAEAPRAAPMNRTARPFPGAPGAQPAAAFSPPRSVASPTADFPAPPPYSAVTPPPGGPARAATNPPADPAQPPPWPQPAPWHPEHIASRDERIAVPAKRTGILQEAKRRSTAKPMFTFKEPKVSPNPELLSLLQSAEGKRGAGADSGPEEDYLSLGAEACNFMHGAAAKQKTPPPVAPKPAVKASSSSQPATPVSPVSPVWSPGVGPAPQPAFPRPPPLQGSVASSIKIAQPSYPPARPASALNLAGPFRGPQAAVASVNHTAKPAAPTPAGSASHVGATAPPSELPGMQGKGAQLFAKRQSRMEKYVVDSDTVQAHAARAQSPTPSLPAGWKYSSNVRAPPPVAYNPIHSPSYPLAAVKSPPSGPQASKTSKKGKTPLSALEVMKHQPYQLSASLFTFQPPDAKAGLPQRSPAKVNAAPAPRQAPLPRAVNASSPTNAQAAASVHSLPAYSPQPAFFPQAASPVSASPVPPGVPGSPKPEVASTAYLVAPRPKFSAKKSGVTAQESGRSLSLPGRPVPPTVSATPVWAHRPAHRHPAQPAAGPEGAHRRLAPWEAAAESPLGLVEEAFWPRDIRDSVVANVVLAARRKVLPAPTGGWGDGLPHALQAPTASVGLCGSREYHGAPLPNSSVPTHSQWLHASYRQPSRNDSWMTSLETRSEYCLSAAEGNYNPRPRGWRRPT